MDLLLVRIPATDDDGRPIERVSAILIGEDVSPEVAVSITEWLIKAESEPSVLVADKAFVSWL